LTRSLGTQFEIDTKDKILLVEDVNEGYLQLDVALSHLFLAEKLDHVKAVVFSQLTNCLDGSAKKIKTFLKSFFEFADYPVFWNLPFGHGLENISFPLGVKAKADSKTKRLVFEEEALKKETID